MKNDMLSTREVSELIRKKTGLRTHPLTIGRLIRNKTIPAINVSNGKIRPRYKVYRNDVIKFIKGIKKAV